MAQRSILIADDEQEAVEILTDFFQDAGYEVLTANNGQEALEHLKNKKPTIAILDLRMPIVDGEAVIRQMPEISPNTKIIVATGYTDEEYIENKVLSQNVDAFLEKPIDLDTLQATIDKLCT